MGGQRFSRNRRTSARLPRAIKFAGKTAPGRTQMANLKFDRVLLTIGIASALAGCCEQEQKPPWDVFNPVVFNTEDMRCSGKELVRQGFSGAMNLGTTIEFIGVVESAGKRFSIAYYDFINLENDHGTTRVLVFSSPCRYFGSYAVTLARPSGTSGPDILFNLPKESGNVIHFENGGPPKRTWVNGENPVLSK